MTKRTKKSSMKDDNVAAKSVPVTPLPKLQVFVICCVQMAEAMNVELLFPFLAFMVEDMGYTGEQLGYHAGILAATFCGAQFCTSVAWGMISDRYGRKFAVVSGTMGAAIGMLIFGFAKTFPQAIVGRIVGGLLCGNLGVVKSFLTEITDDTNRSSAFYLFSLSWAVGSVLAPLIGGMLCKPAEKYPSIFPSGPNSLWVEYPYLLPCLLTVGISVVSALQCLVFMVETVGVKRDQYESLSVSENVHNSLSSEIDSVEEGVQMVALLPPTSSTAATVDVNPRGRSSSVAKNDDTVRARAFSTEKYSSWSPTREVAMNLESQAPIDAAEGEYTTDYDSTMVHRRLHDSHNHSTNNSSSTSSSVTNFVFTNLQNDVLPEDETPSPPPLHPLPTYGNELPEYEVNKLSFPPGQSVANTGTSQQGRVRNRSRSTSDGYDRYSQMSTADIESSMRLPSAATSASASRNMFDTDMDASDNTYTGTNNDYNMKSSTSNAMHRDDDDDILSDDDHSDLEDGLHGTSAGEAESEEICCPTFFDNAALLGRYLSCTNKTRAMDNSMESSSHGLIESDSNKSLNSLDTADTTTSTNNSTGGKLSTGAILTQRVVILATLNYGMVCASSILLDETLPLFMKLDSSHGGFGFDSTAIGTLLSTGAAGMMALTVLTMPLTNGVSNKYLSKMSIVVSTPLALGFPAIALLNNYVLVHLHPTLHMCLLWPTLILVNTLKNLFSCFTFTSSIIMVNHSVTDEYLGAVNGLGQSLGALARCLGPAVGGLMWSLSTKYDFVYLNFIGVIVLYACNYYVSYLVPNALDHRKKSRRNSKKQ